MQYFSRSLREDKGQGAVLPAQRMMIQILIQIAMVASLVAVVIQLKGVRTEMAISRAQLDQDLAALVSGITALIAAVQALPQPGDEDFTAEDGSVQQAAAAVQAELNAIQPPPPPGPSKPA
jgi:hypothetical protein